MSTVAEPTEAQLAGQKRKQEDEGAEPVAKMAKSEVSTFKPSQRGSVSKARKTRLEQNRKAARESRRRKKVMIEELQRSVIFFSRANGTLKQQNEELSRLTMQANSQVAAIEGQQNAQPNPPQAQMKVVPAQGNIEQAKAQAVATQAVYESQGFPSAAARAAAQTMNGAPSPAPTTAAAATTPAPVNGSALPAMQPGATMQAMANFQQAAAAAMQAAVQGMQSIPGLSLQALTATAPAGANPQQAYNDTMTALAMQQAAAAAAAGQPFFQQNPFMAHSMMAWQGQQAAAGQQTPAPAPAQS